MLAFLPCSIVLSNSTLTVGDGMRFSRIEDAVAAAHEGAVVEVYPSSSGYARTAVRLQFARVTIKGIGASPVRLDGSSYAYSGEGRIPRAIFQIEPAASGAVIENFELIGAHNGSFNGAGVRINAANRVTIRGCDIHGCDMGIMSNGIQGDKTAGAEQLIDHCRIHENGNPKDPGQNHNLYLGGSSVTVQFCDIFSPVTGHNLKSRAHFNIVQYCYIHDSANRELDFVEAWDTERPNSNALLLGNVIEKGKNSAGNHITIHFGKEHGKRDGTVYLVNNTIVTHFSSPVLELSAALPRAGLLNNVIVNTEASEPTLVQASSPYSITGSTNWLSRGYSRNGFGLIDSIYGESRASNSLSGGGLTFTLHKEPAEAQYRDGDGQLRPAKPAYRYSNRGNWVKSDATWIGAG